MAAIRSCFARALCACAAVALPVLFGCDGRSGGDARLPPDPQHSAQVNPSRELRIAAAADLKFALPELIARFEEQHAGANITATYGSSGSLFAQLLNEAPFDLYLSADRDFPHRLADEGRAEPGSEFAYATGHLVLWVPAESKLDVDQEGIDALRDRAAAKIAVANPQTAPYGRAAVAALKSLGIYDLLESRLVYGENVAQTAQMVESGAADAGLLSLSLAVSRPLRDKGKFWRVPGDAHPAIVQGGVILGSARDSRLAREFRDFLVSTEGVEILERFGFEPAGE